MTIWKYAYNETEKKVVLVQGDSTEKFFTNLHTDGYFDSLVYAKMGVHTVNKKIADGCLLVKKCVDCGKYYFMTIDEEFWFKDRGLSVPKRCLMCRRDRKKRERW